MLDIRHSITSIIGQDPVFLGFSGGTLANPGIYFYYPGQPIPIDDGTHEAYVTYNQITFPEETKGTGDPMFMLTAYARTIGVADQVASRIKGLLHKKTFITENSRKIYTKIIFMADTFQQIPNYAGMSIHLRVSYLNIPQTLSVMAEDAIHPSDLG